MLTPAAAKAATPSNRAYKLSDAAGLHLHVAPTGCKAWRWRYRRDGREQLLTIGRYPKVSLVEARAMRDAARAQLQAGGDPALATTQGPTFNKLADAWLRHKEGQWSPQHARDVMDSLMRDIFPAIGQRAANSITAPEVLVLLRKVEARGRLETAQRLRQRMSMIFAFGVAEGLIDNDPAARVGVAMLKPRPTKPQPALLKIEACRALLKACDELDVPQRVRLASRFLALTAVRLEAVRGMRWREIEGLDGHEPVWHIPAARMKLSRDKKGDPRFDHLVPLSVAAMGVLQEVVALNRADGYAPDPDALVFPGPSLKAPLGQNAIGSMYAEAGYRGRHVPHGWRASFSTILNETMGEDWSPTIDQALGHTPKNKVEAAYNRAPMLARRRAIFDRWGGMLAPPRLVTQVSSSHGKTGVEGTV